jgi:hypothetical protein
MHPENVVLYTTTSSNTACAKSSDPSAKNFTRLANGVSRKGGKHVLIMKGALWKNTLNAVQDVSVIGVKFVVTVITVSEKKIEGITLVPPLVYDTKTKRKEIQIVPIGVTS